MMSIESTTPERLNMKCWVNSAGELCWTSLPDSARELKTDNPVDVDFHAPVTRNKQQRRAAEKPRRAFSGRKRRRQEIK